MKFSLIRSFCLVLLLTQYAVAVTVRAQENGKVPDGQLSEAWGQKFWSSENGLPQNSVHQILQTRDGYLWIATEGGVARFDGIQFAVFTRRIPRSLPATIRAALLRMGEAVFGLERPTVSCDLRPARFVAIRRPTDCRPPSSNRSLWLMTAFHSILTAGGLAKYDGEKFTPLALSASALGTGFGNTVWLAVNGIFAYSHEHLRAAPVPGLPTEPIEGLGSLRDGSQWVRTRTAFLLWSQGRLQTWRAGRELPGTRVQSFLEDSHGSLWVGTDQGLVALPSAHTADKVRLESMPLLGANSILTMFEDREHNLWVGTDTTGLHVLQQQKFRTLPSLAGVPISAVTQTMDGTVWLGSKDEGLFRYKGGETRHLSTKDGLISDVILALAGDRDGSLWIGTPDGLNHLSGQKIESYTSADGLPDDLVRSLFATTMELSGLVHAVALLIANTGNSPSFPWRTALRVI